MQRLQFNKGGVKRLGGEENLAVSTFVKEKIKLLSVLQLKKARLVRVQTTSEDEVKTIWDLEVI